MRDWRCRIGWHNWYYDRITAALAALPQEHDVTSESTPGNSTTPFPATPRREKL